MVKEKIKSSLKKVKGKLSKLKKVNTKKVKEKVKKIKKEDIVAKLKNLKKVKEKSGKDIVEDIKRDLTGTIGSYLLKFWDYANSKLSGVSFFGVGKYPRRIYREFSLKFNRGLMEGDLVLAEFTIADGFILSLAVVLTYATLFGDYNQYSLVTTLSVLSFSFLTFSYNRMKNPVLKFTFFGISMFFLVFMCLLAFSNPYSYVDGLSKSFSAAYSDMFRTASKILDIFRKVVTS